MGRRPQVAHVPTDVVHMTRLLGRRLHSEQETPAAAPPPAESPWQPLPDDVAECMGMAPYPRDR